MSDDGGLPEQITEDVETIRDRFGEDWEPPMADEIEIEDIQTQSNAVMDVRLGGSDSAAEFKVRPVFEPGVEAAVELNVELGPARLRSSLAPEDALAFLEELERAIAISEYYVESDGDPYPDSMLDASHLPGGRDR